MYILSIEGNIGTGKSTIIKIIKEILDKVSAGKMSELGEKYKSIFMELIYQIKMNYYVII